MKRLSCPITRSLSTACRDRDDPFAPPPRHRSQRRESFFSLRRGEDKGELKWPHPCVDDGGMAWRGDYFDDLHGDVVEWCRGRWWLLRAPLVVWFAYLLYGFLAVPEFGSVFGPIDLGIHELGHIIWSPLGQFMGILGGSLTQCLAPVISMILFYRQRDFFALAFCFGWLGINFFEVATYAADARSMSLQLVTPFAGEAIHDWYYLLNGMGLLALDKAVAFLLRSLAVLSFATFLASGVYLFWLMATLPRRRTASRL